MSFLCDSYDFYFKSLNADLNKTVSTYAIAENPIRSIKRITNLDTAGTKNMHINGSTVMHRQANVFGKCLNDR